MSPQRTPSSKISITSVSLPWDHIQQALELCAGISELEGDSATQTALKQLAAEFQRNTEADIHASRQYGSYGNLRTVPFVHGTPSERFKIRKRAAVTSREIEVIKQALTKAEEELNLLTKNHGIGNPAIMSLDEAEMFVKQAEQSRDLKAIMDKVDGGLAAEDDEGGDGE